MIQENKHKAAVIQDLKAAHRLLISLLFGSAAFLIVPGNQPLISRLMLAWIVFSVIYLALCWFVIATLTIPQLKKKASEEDGSKMLVFVMVTISSLASMFGVLFLIKDKITNVPESIAIITGFVSMILSWFLVHTIFTFHYAHLYYNGKKQGGLDFPGSEEPDLFDFAYFSFCIGSTFQVSDVEISAKEIRKFTLVHSLLSFGLNSFVVALTINILAGLSK